MTEMPHRPEPAPRAPKAAIFLILPLLAAMAITMILRIFEDFSWPRANRARASIDHGKIVEQYTRFRREDVEGGAVMTGFEFVSSNDRAPASQYCYFAADKTGSGVKLHLSLGRKVTGAAADFFPITPEQAEQVGLSADLAAKLARERCRFDQWE